MAVKDPLAPDARKPSLSAEDAEHFASQIRPSWEFIDGETVHSDMAFMPEPSATGTPLPPNPSGSPGPIIQGIPTIAITDRAEATPGAALTPMAPEGNPERTPSRPPADAPTAADSRPADKPAHAAAHAHPSALRRTQVGIGSLADEATIVDLRAPKHSSAGAERASGAAGLYAPASAPASAPVPASPSHGADEPSAIAPVDGDETDDIEIPIAGAPKGFALKLGIGAVALIGLVIGGKALLGSGDKPAPIPVATSTPTETMLSPAPPPPPPPPPEDPGTPTAAETTAPSPTAAPSAPPTAAATAAPPEAPAPEAPAPEARAPEARAPEARAPEARTKPPAAAATVAPAVTREKPPAAAAPPPPKPRPPISAPKKPPPPSGADSKKGGGGIIRETPF
jgi:hypothetical protein